MTKVLFTASTFSHIRSFHVPYIRWFRDIGCEVHVACGGEPGPVEGASRTVGLSLEKSMTSPGNLAAASALRRLIAEERYDLISTHTSLAAFFTRLALKGLRERPKVVDIVHG